MRYKIRHTTRYEYAQSVNQCSNIAYVLPRDTSTQRCVSSVIKTSPQVSSANERNDYFGNRAYHFSIDDDHNVLEVTAESLIDLVDQDRGISLDLGISCKEACLRTPAAGNVMTETADSQQTQVDEALAMEYTMESPLVSFSDEIADYARPSFAPDRPFLSAVRDFTHRIHMDYEYDPDFSEVTTRVSEVFAHRKGVCQDFAHLAICGLRSLGYAARYVSGYLETTPAPGQVKLTGSDASHAWFSVFSPGEGWFDFDPTNNIPVSQQHITTAWGRDYADVSPLRGVIFGGGNTHVLTVEVDVTRF